MMSLKKILILITVGIFFLSLNGFAPKEDSEESLFEKAKKEIYRLNFEKAYGFLSKITRKYPHSSFRDKSNILKNIISLGQTFSNLRLYSAYTKGKSFYKKEKKSKDSLSPSDLFHSYRLEYLKRIKKWAKRLDKDIKETLRVSKEIELSIKYPGTKGLPYFIKAGIDNIENIKKGIPPTPSQAQNIEEQEAYTGVLSVIFLCIQRDMELPEKTFLIEGNVIPKLLIHYSNLWLNKVLMLTEKEREIVL